MYTYFFHRDLRGLQLLDEYLHQWNEKNLIQESDFENPFFSC